MITDIVYSVQIIS